MVPPLITPFALYILMTAKIITPPIHHPRFGVLFKNVFLWATLTALFTGCALQQGRVGISPLPKKGYFLKRIAPDVYFFSTGVYNNMFVVTPEGVLITDPIGGKGRLLKKAIAEVTVLPIKFMIYSHPYRDHIGDAHLFSQGVQIIAHRETEQILRRYKDPKRPLPHIVFGKNYTLNFGGIKFELIYPGQEPGHGNIIIFIPRYKVLMFVDASMSKAAPFKNLSAADIHSHIKGIEKALQLDFKTYVGGHFYRPGKRQEMREVLQYYYATREANKKALKRVSFKSVRAKTKSGDMQGISGEYYEAVAEVCYRILKKDWKQRLMGFETYARRHCNAWTTFHRTHQAP